ncbi:MAG: aldo/keto reductase [Coriobacteriales bacterium]
MDFGKTGGYTLSDGQKIPKIGFGTFNMDDSTACTAVDAAIGCGYRLIDCARFYGDEKGVGQALSSTDVDRDELFISSKVWNDRQLDGTVRQSAEETLRDLGIDQLDMLLIHWPVRDAFPKTWEIFMEMKEDGLVKSIGVCNFLPEHLEELAKRGYEMPVVDQMEHHPYLRYESARKYCREHGIVYEAWSPLGRGGCISDPVVAQIAEAHDATPAQVIIGWHIQSGVLPLPKSANPEHIKSNLQMLDAPLTDEEIGKIDALNKNEPIIEGVDPIHFNEILNGESSHFDD